MLELYHNEMSVCAQKVRLGLAEKGQDWTGHHLNLRAGDTQKPEYLKLNPNAVVPTIVHDGAVIIESTVINEYVDDAFSGPPLKAKDAASRARMRLWTKQLDEGVHAAVGSISQGIAFRHQHASKTPAELDAYINGIPDPARRERIRDLLTKGADSSYVRSGVLRFRKLLADMNAALAERPWLAGADYSLADIGFAPYITRLDHLDLRGMYEAQHPRIAEWYDRLRQRPAYEVAFVKWFNKAYIGLMREKGAEAWPKVKAIVAD